MASVLGSQMPNFLLCLHMVFSLLHALLVSLPLVRAPNLIGLKPNPYSLVVVIQLLSCVRLYDPMACMPGSSILHYLPEFAQIHIH